MISEFEALFTKWSEKIENQLLKGENDKLNDKDAGP